MSLRIPDDLQVGDAVHFDGGPRCPGDQYRTIRSIAPDRQSVIVWFLGIPRLVPVAAIREAVRPTPDETLPPSSVIDLKRIRTK